ncbi:MAG: outer membrane beta-barrel protein [Elusimicrobiota bacterium]|nr:outer membrane beta-barrel protein [Elusimicrobiota bacterium]
MKTSLRFAPRWISALVLAAAVLAPEFARAEGPEIAEGVSLGGRAMYYRPKGADEGSLSGGAQLRVHLSSMFALEGSIDYRKSTFGTVTVDVYPVQASLLMYLLPSSPLTPYLLAGGGWYYTHVRAPYEKTQYRFGPHAGAGLKMSLSKSWSIDGSYRYLWTRDINSEDLAHPAGRNFSDNGYMLTASLNHHF